MRLCERLNRYTPPSEYRDILADAEVLSVEADREARLLRVRVSLTYLVSKGDLYRIEEGVKEAYNLSFVQILPSYPPELFSLDYVPEILREAGRVCSVANGFFNHASVAEEDNTVEISIPFGGGGISLLTIAKTEEALANILMSEFSLVKSFKIRTSDEQESFYASFDERQHARLEEANRISRENVAKRSAYRAAEQAERQSEAPAVDVPSTLPSVYQDEPVRELIGDEARSGKMTFDISAPEFLLGGEFDVTAFVPIREFCAPKRGVVFLGEIFGVECEPTRKGDKNKISFCLTDNDSSAFGKVTASLEDTDEILSVIKNGNVVAMRGNVRYNDYEQELEFHYIDVAKISKKGRKDTAPEKRVELHLHTMMSAMDATIDTEKIIKLAQSWGHKAIAITDHGNVQAYQQAMLASEKLGMNVIYGMEAYFVDDTARAVYGEANPALDGEFVVFDIETTGLSPLNNNITEIGAVLVRGGEIVDEFNILVNPGEHISDEIVRLTGIDDAMVADADKIDVALPKFFEFAGDRMLVAHNASFDTSFIRCAADRLKLPFANSYLDTVALSKYLNPKLAKHKLDSLAEYYKLGDFNHHRACDDARMLAMIFLKMTERLRSEGVTDIGQMNRAMAETADPLRLPTYHQILLVKNKQGLKNLYKLISKSYLEYYRKFPRIPKTQLDELREGLIVGSACEAGELFKALLENKPESEIERIANYYDYLEIQPICNNRFLVDEGRVANEEGLRDLNRRIVALGEKFGKPVVATCDAHFINKEDEIFRKVLLVGKKFADGDKDTGIYFRTTEEMLDEFAYLGEEKAREVVIDNPNSIADQIDFTNIRPFPKGTFTPNMEGAEEDLQRMCYEKAHSMYGNPLPELVQKRLEKELNSIISNGFAVLYMIAQKLVKYSEDQGYLVGSRGSVGSSVVASMGGISEVNPLPPHYYCPNCQYSKFFEDGSVGSGFDLPDANCPNCGTKLVGDGHDIPFETFLGFYGDKSPDIDLNFSGDVQGKVHKYTEELFGKENVFRAGTIGALADKTAYGFALKYAEEHGYSLGKAELNRIVNNCVGVKRTTGQHPGGIVVVPKEYEIYDFCPVQHPADDPNSDIVTTHFTFEYLHDTLLKLDELGHDIPTKYKYLERYSNTSVMDVPMNDRAVYELFASTKPLGATPEAIGAPIGTLGLPEFGTGFVMPVVIGAKPKNFADLLQVSGLTHGTGLWVGNAQDLIANGVCTISNAVGTRDSIMLALIRYGLDDGMAFKIMEMVRKNKKGKPIPDDMQAAMRDKNVDEWYIDSLQKIRYMFPKAHAAAYVMSAIRLGWYKVHMPVVFYAAYWSAAPDGFDAVLAMKGKRAIEHTLEEIKNKSKKDRSQKDDATYSAMQLANEFLARGLKFLPVDLMKSDAKLFIPEDGKLRLPFGAIGGIGETAAEKIVDARNSGEVYSVEEFIQKAKLPNAVIEILRENGVFGSMPDTNQLSMF